MSCWVTGSVHCRALERVLIVRHRASRVSLNLNHSVVKDWLITREMARAHSGYCWRNGPDQVLHLTSTRVPLTGFQRRLMQRNLKTLDGWAVQVWADADNDGLVGEYFPEYVDTFRALPFGVMRADGCPARAHACSRRMACGHRL
jgi:hypothetical protein